MGRCCPSIAALRPIQWAIARGETMTGVTTMRIDAGLDTGDILLQKEIPIAPRRHGCNPGSAHGCNRRRADGRDPAWIAGLERLIRALRTSRATLAPILKKEDGKIDFQLSAQEILNRLRGFQPWPGAYTSFRGKNLHIWAAQPSDRLVAAAKIFAEMAN